MMPDCEICRGIPRRTVDRATRNATTHEAGARLAPPPRGENGTRLCRCPECGALYLFERSSEYDDMDEYVDASLRRLSYVEQVERSEPAERAALVAAREAYVARWRAELSDELDWVRRDAAWNLLTLDRSELPALQCHTDSVVRQEAVFALGEENRLVPLSEELLEGLRAASHDTDPKTRASAARLLAADTTARRGVAALVDELLTES